jgi:hypothetical protein
LMQDENLEPVFTDSDNLFNLGLLCPVLVTRSNS